MMKLAIPILTLLSTIVAGMVVVLRIKLVRLKVNKYDLKQELQRKESRVASLREDKEVLQALVEDNQRDSEAKYSRLASSSVSKNLEDQYLDQVRKLKKEVDGRKESQARLSTEKTEACNEAGRLQGLMESIAAIVMANIGRPPKVEVICNPAMLDPNSISIVTRDVQVLVDGRELANVDSATVELAHGELGSLTIKLKPGEVTVRTAEPLMPHFRLPRIYPQPGDVVEAVMAKSAEDDQVVKLKVIKQLVDQLDQNARMVVHEKSEVDLSLGVKARTQLDKQEGRTDG